MREIIIKLFTDQEEFKQIVDEVNNLVAEHEGVMKAASKEDEQGYRNVIFQVGENKPDVEIIVKRPENK